MRLDGIFLLAVTVLISSLAYAGEYSSVQVVSPEPEETIHDNNGSLVVTVAISPPLRTDAGHQLVLLLDGYNVASGGSLSYELTDIDRGSHTLQAQVVAADGSIVAASPQIAFHMWRASRLFRRHD